jgi:hypothetical protein
MHRGNRVNGRSLPSRQALCFFAARLARVRDSESRMAIGGYPSVSAPVNARNPRGPPAKA